MKIAISGASGFIGEALTNYLSKKGCTVLPIRRILLDSIYSRELTQLLSQVEVVINLAGASLNKRWSTSYKKEIYESRIHTTRRLAETIDHLPYNPSLFISASAVGYYPANGEYSEQDTTPGKSFLAEVCAAWEKEAEKYPLKCVRSLPVSEWCWMRREEPFLK
ncbi:MAG: NAD-dependent epimerase/dehydratase family protein [Bacteroides sp.]|nr:NAD-dependent epimerase/dehydratase family protein [Bacteroides sp.]